jgi:hypothetical protein
MIKWSVRTDAVHHIVQCLAPETWVWHIPNETALPSLLVIECQTTDTRYLIVCMCYLVVYVK